MRKEHKEKLSREQTAEITTLMKETGVIMEGHFLLTSGRHSDTFLQCSQILQYPGPTSEICRLVAEPFSNQEIATVIGPAMGGVILSYETARWLDARTIYAEPSEGKMILRRGFSIKPGERVLVVEDAVSTGGSVQKVIDLLHRLEAEVVGVSVLIDRSDGRVDFGVPSSAILTMNIESFEPQNCPLCQKGIPLVKPKA